MISLKVSTKKFSEIHTQGYAFFLEEDFLFSKELKGLAGDYFPALDDFFKERGFRGAQSSAVVLPVLKDKKIIHLIFVGLGSKDDKHFDFEYYRRALGKIIRAAESHKLTSVAVSLPSASLFGVTKDYLAQQTATIIHMAGYHFDEFKRERLSTVKREITLCVSTAEQKAFSHAAAAGEVIAEAVNTTRHWIDTPPSRLTPTILAGLAAKVAKESGLKLTVFNESEVTKMGMGGIAAVAAGSEQDAKLIILEHKVSKKKPTIAFVGKGITFDSGGLSIKPANSMETMKEDMAGAAAVINAIGALGKLKADVNIVALAPTTENLPSGTATKPGDVIRFYNGVTAEVKNTDAEGRLVLADALSYAVEKYKPDFIIDLATLTGACDYAVGPFYSGMLSQNEEMAERVLKASATSGDRIWRLPMHNDYEVAIKSDVADICNIGKSNYKAGTITATFFLKHFVDKTPWVHLDIASNAFAVPGTSYYGSGATGVGVRLLVDLALSWK
jgi:leucyl aminopeptidase